MDNTAFKVCRKHALESYGGNAVCVSTQKRIGGLVTPALTSKSIACLRLPAYIRNKDSLFTQTALTDWRRRVLGEV